MMGKLVDQFPTNPTLGKDRLEGAIAEGGRDPYRTAAPRPPSGEPVLPPETSKNEWPKSVSRDEPEKLSEATRAHTFFVRTKRSGILTNLGVLEFLAKCPMADDGEGVLLHRDVLYSLGYHLLDKVHELETLQGGMKDEGPRYDERLSKALDGLGTRDAEIKELRAALGEATIKIRRLESKIFK